MRALDEDALFCDFAEYYHVFNWDALPIGKQAILACGLPAQSRIKKLVANMDFDFDTLLLAAILDQERIANWRYTKDAKAKRNFPKSVVEAMTFREEKQEEKVQTFDSGEEFKARYMELSGRG